MRVLFWFCERFAWTPAMKTLEEAPEALPGTYEKTVAAFVHMEPKDMEEGSQAETKLVKNAKWLARKWETDRILLHSFTHLGEEKADPEQALILLNRAQARLESAGYSVGQTPYGHFLNLSLDAPGHPLARIYKEF
ncbi:MAG: threonyl-tRNA synthetase editing domain-containing protein [Desulfobacterales bacterium]